MSNWIEIGNIEDIPRLGSRVVDNGGKEIAIFRTAEDSIFALRNKCPHKNGPLSEGIVHGNKVACPLHNWNIDLASGEAQAPDKGCTRKYEVRLEGDKILLAV